MGGRLQPERLGHDLAEQFEVAVSLRVRPVVDHDLAADFFVAVEGDLEHDVAGIKRKDAAVWGLEQLREPLGCELVDVSPSGSPETVSSQNALAK